MSGILCCLTPNNRLKPGKSRPGQAVAVSIKIPAVAQGASSEIETAAVAGTSILGAIPVFYNGANGYDTYSGNPIGRVVTVGVRGNF